MEERVAINFSLDNNFKRLDNYGAQKVVDGVLLYIIGSDGNRIWVWWCKKKRGGRAAVSEY